MSNWGWMAVALASIRWTGWSKCLQSQGKFARRYSGKYRSKGLKTRALDSARQLVGETISDRPLLIE